MGRKLGNLEGAALGEVSIESRYAAVQERGRRMEGVFDAISSVDFFVAAWHLIADWLPVAQGDHYRLARSKLRLDKLPAEMQLLRSTLRDVATGEKHCILLPKEETKKVVTEVEPGKTGDWYAFFFHERILGVTTKDDYYFSVRKLRDLVLDYLAWVFDDSIPAGSFPGALLGKIWVCKTANRFNNATPPIGAIIPPNGDPGFVTREPGTQ